MSRGLGGWVRGWVVGSLLCTSGNGGSMVKNGVCGWWLLLCGLAFCVTTALGYGYESIGVLSGSVFCLPKRVSCLRFTVWLAVGWNGFGGRAETEAHWPDCLFFLCATEQCSISSVFSFIGFLRLLVSCLLVSVVGLLSSCHSLTLRHCIAYRGVTGEGFQVRRTGRHHHHPSLIFLFERRSLYTRTGNCMFSWRFLATQLRGLHRTGGVGLSRSEMRGTGTAAVVLVGG